MKKLDYVIGSIALGAFVLLIVENTPFGDAHATVFHWLNVAVLTTFAADVLFRLIGIALAIVMLFSVVLLHVEQKPFRDILFETVSAFGTVGLSTGITSSLTPTGRMLITVLMFIGRLGPLTIAYALVRTAPPARYTYAEQRVMIG